MATKRSSAKKKHAVKSTSSETLAVTKTQWTLKSFVNAFGIKGKAAWNIIISLGPRALALWPAGSRNLLNHQTGKEAIAGWKNALDRETANFAEVEKNLIARIPEAKAEELIEIQQKIEFLRGLRCQGNVVSKALTHLATKPDSLPSLPKSEGDSSNNEKQSTEISEHWFDHFNRFARQRNEPWRELLLARALAAESENPGTISSRLLWILGTLEPSKFEVLSTLLDLSATIAGAPIIPGDNIHQNLNPIPGFQNSKRRLTNLATSLSDSGLLHEYDTVHFFEKDETILASYDTESYNISCNDLNGYVAGIIFTDLGSSLAKLYDPSPNDFGRKIFDHWIKDLIPSRYSIKKC